MLTVIVVLIICVLGLLVDCFHDELKAVAAVVTAIAVVMIQHHRTMAKLRTTPGDPPDAASASVPPAYVIDQSATGLDWWRERLIWLAKTAWRNAQS